MFCFITEESLLNKILEAYLKTAEGCTKCAWRPHAALKTVDENH